MDEFIIRKVVDQDVEKLAALYEDVWPNVTFDKREKANFVLRKSRGVSYCAEKDGELVGSRTSFFMPILYGKEPIKTVQFADSCVRSDCRRKGLFSKLNKAFLHDFFVDNQGELIYNISVDDSRKAYEKLGWVYIESLKGISKYKRIWSILRKTRGDIRKLRGAILLDTNSDVKEIDSQLLYIRKNLFDQTQTIHVDYTETNLSWRLSSNNGIRVFFKENVGAIIYKWGRKGADIDVAVIGEIFLYSYDKKSLKTLEKAFFEEIKPDMLFTLISIAHPLYSLYIANGYFASKGFSNHGVRVESDRMKNIALNPQNWAISFMDIDTF